MDGGERGRGKGEGQTGNNANANGANAIIVPVAVHPHGCLFEIGRYFGRGRWLRQQDLWQI